MKMFNAGATVAEGMVSFKCQWPVCYDAADRDSRHSCVHAGG